MIAVVYNFGTEMHLVGKVMSAFVLLSTTIARASASNFVHRPPLFERPLWQYSFQGRPMHEDSDCIATID